MSNFTKKTMHPVTTEWFEAEWLDNYYGPRKYGVRFPNGDIFPAEEVSV